MSFFRPVKVGAAAGLTLVLAAACGTSASSSKQSPSAPADGKVSISVVSLPPGSDKAAFKAFDDQVAIFVKAHPNITVKPQEYEWKGTTFAAQLAGGYLADGLRGAFHRRPVTHPEQAGRRSDR